MGWFFESYGINKYNIRYFFRSGGWTSTQRTVPTIHLELIIYTQHQAYY